MGMMLRSRGVSVGVLVGHGGRTPPPRTRTMSRTAIQHSYWPTPMTHSLLAATVSYEDDDYCYQTRARRCFCAAATTTTTPTPTADSSSLATATKLNATAIDTQTNQVLEEAAQRAQVIAHPLSSSSSFAECSKPQVLQAADALTALLAESQVSAALSQSRLLSDSSSSSTATKTTRTNEHAVKLHAIALRVAFSLCAQVDVATTTVSSHDDTDAAGWNQLLVLKCIGLASRCADCDFPFHIGLYSTMSTAAATHLPRDAAASLVWKIAAIAQQALPTTGTTSSLYEGALVQLVRRQQYANALQVLQVGLPRLQQRAELTRIALLDMLDMSYREATTITSAEAEAETEMETEARTRTTRGSKKQQQQKKKKQSRGTTEEDTSEADAAFQLALALEDALLHQLKTAASLAAETAAAADATPNDLISSLDESDSDAEVEDDFDLFDFDDEDDEENDDHLFGMRLPAPLARELAQWHWNNSHKDETALSKRALWNSIVQSLHPESTTLPGWWTLNPWTGQVQIPNTNQRRRHEKLVHEYIYLRNSRYWTLPDVTHQLESQGREVVFTHEYEKRLLRQVREQDDLYGENENWEDGWDDDDDDDDWDEEEENF